MKHASRKPKPMTIILDLRSYVEVIVDVLGFPSLTVRTVSVDVVHWTLRSNTEQTNEPSYHHRQAAVTIQPTHEDEPV